MNIIIIPAFFQTKENPTFGSFFTDQARALLKGGHQVSILYCDTFSVKCVRDFLAYDETAVSDMDGIKIYRKRIFCPLKHGMEGYREQFAQGIAALYDMYLAGGKTDIIHAHCCVWAGYAGMKLSEKLKVPYVITEHATLFQLHHDEISSKNDAFIREAFTRASRLICVSRAFAGLLAEYRTDIDIVGNVVDCDRFGIADIQNKDDTIRFLTVCYMLDEEMLHKKGIDILLKSWKALVARVPKARLTIGGGGRGRRKAAEWCREYGIGDTVEFAGPLDRGEVAARMQACDVFVLPSRYETFGVVYIEAMACGKPVIAVKNGGPDDFVMDFNGVLVPPEDENGLTEAMAGMAARIRQGQAYDAHEIAAFVRERFSGQAVAKELTRIYHQVVRG